MLSQTALSGALPFKIKTPNSSILNKAIIATWTQIVNIMARYRADRADRLRHSLFYVLNIYMPAPYVYIYNCSS